MRKNEILPPDLFYTLYLQKIQNVNVTQREVDVIACILNGRSSKKISAFLDISPRTVDSHIRNLSHKLECHSREGIIDFIEKSEEYPALKSYYSSLVINIAFEKILSEIKGLMLSHPCKLVYCRGIEAEENLCVEQIKAHLTLVAKNLSVEIIKEKDFQKSFSSLKEHIIYVLSHKVFKRPEDVERLFSQSQKASSQFKLLYLVLDNEAKECEALISQDNVVNFRSQDNYYLSFFQLLKQVLQGEDIEKYIQDISLLCKKNSFSFEIKQPLMSSDTQEIKSSNIFQKNIIRNVFCSWKVVTPVILGACLLGLFFFPFSERGKKPTLETFKNFTDEQIRSDFIIPAESALLNRPELLTQIAQAFREKEGIQTVALVGIGGAGKTTLARQYASEQKANVIWEINAETQESLAASFDRLAQALAKTEENQKIIRELLEIKKPAEREQKILGFVKDQLKIVANWFLIYDNVEKFTDIQSYLPQDSNTWGDGKILLTTRDRNIQNNNQINRVVYIEELTQKQKLDLFSKIMNQGMINPLTNINHVESVKFLENIPPFPLDITVAAYYLKATNISYNDYLKNLKNYDSDFLNVQENLLKEAGTYLKTRYGIITLSLEHILKSHKDFGELLLFVSLLDPEDISKDILDRYKNSAMVDNLVYHLKKYSLITKELPSNLISGPSYTLHRSTQKIILAYLSRSLNLEKKHSILAQILSTLEKYFTDINEIEDLSKMKVLQRHCEKILFSHKELLDPQAENTIKMILGAIYFNLGNYHDAKAVLEKAFKNLGESQQKDYNKIANVLLYLGATYRELGDHEKAKNSLEQSLKIYQQYFPKNDIKIAEVLTYLGNSFTSLGDYEKAKNLLELGLKIYNKNGIFDDIRVAKILEYLAYVYRTKGNYPKAQNLFQQSFRIYQRAYPEGHVRIARTSGSLGSLYKTMGYYSKAIDLFEKSLSLNKANYPEDHPDIAWVLCHLGDAYGSLGNYKKAEELLEKGLLIYKKNQFKHVRISLALRYLGNIHNKLGNYEKAKSMLKNSLSILEEKNKKDYPATARTLRDLGQVYLMEDAIDMSEQFFNQSLAIFRQDNHPDSYTSLEILAELYNKKSKITENKEDSRKFESQAKNYLKQAVEIVKVSLPIDSPHRIRIEDKMKKLNEEEKKTTRKIHPSQTHLHLL